MPVFKDAACIEPERVVFAGFFGGGLVGAEPDPRFAFGFSVEVDGSVAAFGGGVELGVVAPLGGSSVDIGPDHAGLAFEGFIIGHAMGWIVMEAGILVPDVFDMFVFTPREFFGKAQPAGHFDDLPCVAHGVPGWVDHLFPVLCAALGVSEHPFALDPHGRREDHVSDGGGGGGIDLGDDDKAALFFGGIAVTSEVGHGDHGIGGLDPHEADITAIKGAKHLDGVVSGLGGDAAIRDFPDIGGELSGFGVHDHAFGEFVGEGSHFTHSSASTGLTCQRERTVARTRDLSDKKMDVVNEVIDPSSPRVLVHPHAPVGDDVTGWIAVERCHVADIFG